MLRMLGPVPRRQVAVLLRQLNERVAQLLDRRRSRGSPGSVSSSAMLLRARSIILPLRVLLEHPDVQLGQLRVHAGEVLAQHALLVVEADREQVAVLLVLVELELRVFELLASAPPPAPPARPSPCARPRACSRGCTRCRCPPSVFAISAARWGFRSETVMSASRESLSGLDARPVPRPHAAESGEIPVRADEPA